MDPVHLLIRGNLAQMHTGCTDGGLAMSTALGCRCQKVTLEAFRGAFKGTLHEVRI